MDIKAAAEKHAGYLLEMRRYFHAHPELSGREYNTSKKIKEELDKMGGYMEKLRYGDRHPG